MNKKITGTVVASAVASLFLSGQVQAKHDKDHDKKVEAKVCCEVEHKCSSKDGCAGKEVMEVKDEAACKEKKGKVVACKK